eukprot:scaffold143572_cov22-Tisochrysis_lutea.AAC.1
MTGASAVGGFCLDDCGANFASIHPIVFAFVASYGSSGQAIQGAWAPWSAFAFHSFHPFVGRKMLG